MEHHFKPERYYYSFGTPVAELTVESGDSIVAPTVDAGSTMANGEPLPQHMRQQPTAAELRESNPLVGPIYVRDAEPGDTLAVDIDEIKLNRPTGWSKFIPHFGSLTGEGREKRMFLNEPLPEMEFDWALDLENYVGRLELEKSQKRTIEVPLHPFLGSIGVAPRYGRVEPALSPGEYGGNMDCVEPKARTTLYLPVFAEGAYLGFGDVHAAQGDGELCGVAIETTAEVRVTVRVIKERPIEWPQLEDDEHIMTVGSARPLMDALRVAQVELLEWLVADYGFDRWEAWQVISQVGTTRVGNVVDPLYSVVAKFPKQYLPSADGH